MSTRPRILITPDHETRPLRRGPTAFFALDGRYARAVQDAGGLPLMAPYPLDDESLDALCASIDGVVLSGGDFDVDPALFGERPHPKLGTLKPTRTTFERALLARAEHKGLPVLGVCGGMQLMNVTRGGTLFQDIDSEFTTTVAHQHPGPKANPAHPVTLVAGTRTARIAGDVAILDVNSTHHQAVKALGASLIATARASDGLVEAIEDPSRAFYVGVQWHPEAMPSERHQAFYRALVDAARAPR